MDSEIKFSFNDYVACNKRPVSWLLGYSSSSPSPPPEIMKVKDPIWTPWENGRKAKVGYLWHLENLSYKMRTLVIPVPWWKVVRCQHRAFIDLKCVVFHTISDQQLCYTVGCPSFTFLKCLWRHILVGWKIHSECWEGRCGKALWFSTRHLLFPSCYGGGAPTRGNLRSGVLQK